MSSEPISYQPTDGLCYDPAAPPYWSREALWKEIVRIFAVCHGCRLCFKYCETFSDLFALLDRKYDGEVRSISAEEAEKLLDKCFQCKLCEVQCPYSPRDHHPYQVDFPKMVHRFRAIRAKERGIPLRDRLLGAPDTLGRLARASFGLANLANRMPLNRILMEKVLRIHRRKLLPDFARQSFETWALRTGRIAAAPGCEVVLFQTCFIQHNEPEIGRDTIEVLEKNGVDVKCVRGLRCCGMPAWEKGNLAAVQSRAKQNLAILLPFVEKGAKIIVINPTCAMMMRREYPQLVAEEDRVAARKLAEAVMDPSEFLWSIRDQERFNTNFLSSPGETVSYHTPCHLRAQAIGFRSRDLLRKIPGVKPTMVQECCGHDGTFSMTVEGFEPSKRVGQKAFAGMKESGAQVWATDCPLASLQFHQHAGVKALHPMSILARAYRTDGFPEKTAAQSEKE